MCMLEWMWDVISVLCSLDLYNLCIRTWFCISLHGLCILRLGVIVGQVMNTYCFTLPYITFLEEGTETDKAVQQFYSSNTTPARNYKEDRSSGPTPVTFSHAWLCCRHSEPSCLVLLVKRTRSADSPGRMMISQLCTNLLRFAWWQTILFVEICKNNDRQSRTVDKKHPNGYEQYSHNEHLSKPSLD